MKIGNVEGITIRAMTAQDIPAYIELFRLVFPHHFVPETKEIFEWEFNKNPAGSSLGMVAIHNRQLVGIYAVVPLRVLVSGEMSTCYEVVASAIHPSYRGGHIFKKLANETFAMVLSKTSSSVLFGFPNEAALKVGERSLSYRRVLSIRKYIKALNFYGLVYKKQRLVALKLLLWLMNPVMNFLLSLNHWVDKDTRYAVKIKPICQIPSDYAEFWQEARQKYKILVVRDKQYIQWRFFDQPYSDNQIFEARAEGKLVGYFVLKIKKHNAFVVDFFCMRKKDIVKSLFYSMLKIVKKQKIWRVHFRVNDEYLEELIAKERFTVSDDRVFVLRDLHGSGSELENKLDQFRAWYLTANSFDIG